MFYPLACVGIHVLMVTYSREFILGLLELVKPKHFLLYCLWVLALGALFAGLQFHALTIPFIVPFLFIIIYSLSVVFESYLLVCRVYKSLTSISIIYSVAFCVFHWLALTQGYTLQMLFTYLLILAALRLVVYVGLALADMKRQIDIPRDGFAFAEVSTLWRHLGFYDVTQSLFNWIDKFIISLVLPAEISAIYYNGAQNIPFLPLLLSAAGSGVLMRLAGVRREQEQADMVRLMNQSGRVLSCIVFPLFFFLFFFRYDLITVLLTDKYAAAVPIFAFSILVLPVKAYSFTTVLQRKHKGAIINIGSVADILLACALIYPLYQWLGLPGVALSFVITTYLQAGFYLIYSARLLHLSPFKLIPVANWLLKFIVFATILIAIRYAGRLYFTGNIPLILGGAVTGIIMVISLLLELNKQKTNGRIE